MNAVEELIQLAKAKGISEQEIKDSLQETGAALARHPYLVAVDTLTVMKAYQEPPKRLTGPYEKVIQGYLVHEQNRHKQDNDRKAER